MARLGHSAQLPNTIPTDQQAHSLMAPNIHVFSEEIKAQVEEKKKKMIRLALL